MHRPAVSQHRNNSNIKIVHNTVEHVLLESIWFLFWWCPLLPVDCFHKYCLSDTLPPPQKIVRRFEILGIEWPGVIGLTWHKSVPWEVVPEVFKCSVLFENKEPPRFSNRTLEYLRHNFPWDGHISHKIDNP